jgi:nitrate/nitrite transport system substrate-binding protein
VLRVRGEQGFVTTMPNTYRALLKAIIDATAFAREAREPQADRRGDRAAQLPQPAGDRVEQVLTGTFADGLGNVARTPTASTSILPLAFVACGSSRR